MEKISVVIPVYNSCRTLATLCRQLDTTLTALAVAFEIILVDDGSKDASYSRMEELQRTDSRIKIIRLKRNYGQQSAIMCGLRQATGDYTVILDDDLQNPPAEIAKLYSKIKEGYDVVYGLPEPSAANNIISGRPLYRRWGTALRDLLFNLLINKPPEIKVGSFRILTRTLVETIIKDKTSFVYISAITFKQRVIAANVKVEYAGRQYGSSNYTFLRLVKIYLRILLNYGPGFSVLAHTGRSQYEIAEMKITENTVPKDKN